MYVVLSYMSREVGLRKCSTKTAMPRRRVIRVIPQSAFLELLEEQSHSEIWD